jgi:hypothetical protein
MGDHVVVLSNRFAQSLEGDLRDPRASADTPTIAAIEVEGRPDAAIALADDGWHPVRILLRRPASPLRGMHRVDLRASRAPDDLGAGTLQMRPLHSPPR